MNPVLIRLRHLALLPVLLCLPLAIQAQTAKDLFLQLPDSLCPLLTSNNRADCIDFLESKMRAVVTNRLGGSSEMTQLTSDYIHLRLTAQSSWEMKVLSAPDSTVVICVVQTVYGSAADSRLTMYSLDWNPLPTSRFFTAPTFDDLLRRPTAEDDVAALEAYRTADLTLLRLALSPQDTGLEVHLSTLDYMEPEKAERLKPFLNSPLRYRWTGQRFESMGTASVNVTP